MNYIVVDFEFNQAFDFEHQKKALSNPNCPFEIIQIGAVRLNENLKETGKFNVYIKPKVYKRLHPYVKKLTGFTKQTFNENIGFETAINDFSKFCGQDYIFCVWGNNDIKLLYKNINFYKLDNKNISKRYVDVQDLCSKKFNKGKNQLMGLSNAIEQLNLPIENDFHDALNDAKYTSLIFVELFQELFDEKSIKTYKLPENKVRQTNKTVDTASLYKYAEKNLGRKLSAKEKKVIKSIYFLGLNKFYNIP